MLWRSTNGIGCNVEYTTLLTRFKSYEASGGEVCCQEPGALTKPSNN
jgi:hypothetical protein